MAWWQEIELVISNIIWINFFFSKEKTKFTNLKTLVTLTHMILINISGLPDIIVSGYISLHWQLIHQFF